MKRFFNNPWVQSICSSLISALIVTIIVYVKDNVETKWIKYVLFMQVYVWHIMIFLIFIVLAVVIYSIFHSHAEKMPFIADTRGHYQRQNWVWDWVYDKSRKKYHIDELHVICPRCNTGVLSVVYMDYKCGYCGADIPHRDLNVVHSATESQIIKDMKIRYPNYAKYIENRES